MSAASLASGAMKLRTTDRRIPAPELTDAGHEVWRDQDGRLAAVGYRRPSGHHLYVPNVGTYVFCSDSDDMVVSVENSAPDDLVLDAFHRVAVPLAFQLHGLQVLHASAVVVDNGVVALCGRSGAGKSTLAYGLGRRGCSLWGDDAVAFELGTDQITTVPLPFRMRLRPASAQWFDDAAHQKGFERSTPWETGAAQTEFRALFVLERTNDVSAEVVDIFRLDAADAFLAVLPHAYYLALDDVELTEELLASYLSLSERLPVFQLRYVPGLSHVTTIAALVEATVRRL